MAYRYARWDGTQDFPALEAEEALGMLADDLLEEGDVRRALQRLFQRGAWRLAGGRLWGLRELLEEIRSRRQEQLDRYDLGSLLQGIQEQLAAIVRQEREGIERRLQEARAAAGPDQQALRDLVERMAERKLQFLERLPPDAAGALRALADYEFMDEGARQAFQELLKQLQQQLLGHYFQGLQQSLQSLKPEDMAQLREMVRELNELLAKRLRGEAADAEFQRFMQRFGGHFPPGISTLEELVAHLQAQAAQMASLLNSMPAAMRQSLQQTLDSLLRDDRLRWDLAQLAGLLEALSGGPQGEGYRLGGQEAVTLKEALDLMGRLQGLDELEQELAQALRRGDPNLVDRERMEELLGSEAAACLRELQEMVRRLEEAGFIRRGDRDLELTPRGIRQLGDKALRDIYSELRRDRIGQHDAKLPGMGSEQEMETKSWAFGDPFLVDIPKSVMNAVLRRGPGAPVRIEVRDLEVYRTQFLTRAATVILLDMSYSMVGTGAFLEGKKVAFALNSLIRSQFPKDYLSLVVFSYFAVELDPNRLLHSDWVQYGGGTNIQEGLRMARQLLGKHKSATRQIILITDAQPTTYTLGWDDPSAWTHYQGPRRRRPEALAETLKEARLCSKDGIIINTFMMAQDPDLMAFADRMTQTNKGRVFFTTSGQLGSYILVDYLRNKRQVL